MFIYESHLGGLYASDDELSLEELHCDECGDSDWLLGEANTRKEAWKILKPLTDINDCGGYDYQYVKDFLREYFNT